MAKKNVVKKIYDGAEIDTTVVTENEKLPGSMVDDKGNTFFDSTDPISRLINAHNEKDQMVGRLSGEIFNRNVGDMKKPIFGENASKESRPIFRLNEDGTKKQGLRPSDSYLNTVVPVRSIAVDMAQASNIPECITTESALTFLGIQIVAFRNSIMFLLNNTAMDIDNVLNSLIYRNLDNIEMNDFTRSSLKYSSVRVRSDVFPRTMLGDLKSYYPIEMDRSYYEGWGDGKRVKREQPVLRVSEATIPIMACEITSGITLNFYDGIRLIKSQLVKIGTDETDIENAILNIMTEYEHTFYPEIARYIINTLEECARIAYVYISSALTKEHVEIPTKPRDYTPPFSYKYPGCCDD